MLTDVRTDGARFLRAPHAGTGPAGDRGCHAGLGTLGPVPGGCASPSALVPPHHIAFNIVEPNYFAWLHVPILKGRGFDAADSAGVVINQTMARTWWPGQDPAGKMLWLGCDRATRRMVPILV
jgi:hypothetical protein